MNQTETNLENEAEDGIESGAAVETEDGTETAVENGAEELTEANAAETGSEDEDTMYQLPIRDGELTWGMTFEEVGAVLGSPTASEEEEFGGTYTWELDEPLECALGDCSELVLYIGKDNLMNIILSGNATGETYSCNVELSAKYLTYLKAGVSAAAVDASEGQANSENG